jgi:hypothetical protein
LAPNNQAARWHVQRLVLDIGPGFCSESLLPFARNARLTSEPSGSRLSQLRQTELLVLAEFVKPTLQGVGAARRAMAIAINLRVVVARWAFLPALPGHVCLV